LIDLIETQRIAGTSAALQEAASAGLATSGGRVRVIMEPRGSSSGAANAARGSGGRVEREAEGLVQISVPIAALEGLARSPAVRFIRPPMRAVPMAITGEGVPLINAEDWHAQGLTGAGVKVAVLDLGFTGYGSLLGTELPASVTTMSFRQDEDLNGGTEHGAAVAEIVHEVAPDADLYLVDWLERPSPGAGVNDFPMIRERQRRGACGGAEERAPVEEDRFRRGEAFGDFPAATTNHMHRKNPSGRNAQRTIMTIVPSRASHGYAMGVAQAGAKDRAQAKTGTRAALRRSARPTGRVAARCASARAARPSSS
jgi:hypothetical protein